MLLQLNIDVSMTTPFAVQHTYYIRLFVRKLADSRVVRVKALNDEAFQFIQKPHAQPDDPDGTFARKVH